MNNLNQTYAMRHGKYFLLIPILSLMIFSFCSSNGKKSEKVKTLPNILFIPVDDLRPELGAYGDEFIKGQAGHNHTLFSG